MDLLALVGGRQPSARFEDRRDGQEQDGTPLAVGGIEGREGLAVEGKLGAGGDDAAAEVGVRLGKGIEQLARVPYGGGGRGEAEEETVEEEREEVEVGPEEKGVDLGDVAVVGREGARSMEERDEAFSHVSECGGEADPKRDESLSFC